MARRLLHTLAAAAAPALAWLALSVGMVPACIFPEFDIVADENLPLSVDKSKIVLNSPDLPHTLDACNAEGKLLLELDPRQAIVNPDGDSVVSAWIVNPADRPTGRPDLFSTIADAPYVEAFTFDACDNPNVVEGTINTIELYLRDRPVRSNESIADIKSIDDPATSTTNLIWHVQVVDLTCCGVTQ